jgi:hypothetical protein
MPYVIPDKKLAVFFSPKSAGTSLRALMFQLENGMPFRPFMVQGEEFDANKLVTNMRYDRVDHSALKGFHRIAIIRDPVRRFLSAYSNRVLHYRELSRDMAGAKLDELGLAPDPDLDLFVEKIGRYVSASRSIRRHTRNQQVFLGRDPAYFQAVFRVEKLSVLPGHLETRFGVGPLELPRLQTGGPKMLPEDVKPATLARIREVVAQDIAYEFHPAYRDWDATQANVVSAPKLREA